MHIQIFGQLSEDLILVGKFALHVGGVVLALLVRHLLHVGLTETSCRNAYYRKRLYFISYVGGLTLRIGFVHEIAHIL